MKTRLFSVLIVLTALPLLVLPSNSSMLARQEVAAPPPLLSSQTQTVCGSVYNNPSDFLKRITLCQDGQTYEILAETPQLPPTGSFVRIYDAVIEYYTPPPPPGGNVGVIKRWSRIEVLSQSPNATCSNTCGVTPPSLPIAPSNLQVSNNETPNSLNLQWQDNSNNESGFIIERDGTEITRVESNVTSYVDQGLTCGQPYEYAIYAYNGAGTSERSNYDFDAPGPCGNQIPTAPMNLRVVNTTQNASALAWIDNSNNEQHFNIYRASGGESFQFVNATHANAISYAEDGLQCGTTYTYRVTAANDAGESDPAQVDARTSDCPGVPTPTVAPTPSSGSHTFSETGKAVEGRFWEMWQGGRSYEDSVYINGFPITDKHPEVNLTDGKTYQTQWFERARLEEHLENQPPYDVLLGLLGVNAAQGRQSEAPFQQVPNPGGDIQWFRETGHTLGDGSEGGSAIAVFWNRLGGLQQFGYPLSQPFMEKSQDNGQAYLVQYFERQRFEYHPENTGTRYEVLLGRLGAEQRGNPQPLLSADQQENALIDLINQHRTTVGQPAFSVDPALIRAARRNAEWLATNNSDCKDGDTMLGQYLDEEGYHATGGFYTDKCGSANDPQSIWNDWYADESFRPAFENPDLVDIGCGWWPQSPQSADNKVWVSCLTLKP